MLTQAALENTTTIRFVVPPLRSGITTITVQNRAGVAQAPMFVQPLVLNDLSPGFITTVAGGTTYIGDGYSATKADLLDPLSMAMDANGNLFIADYRHNRIRKVNAATGIITTIAGTGELGFSGDGQIATAANMERPWAIAFDPAGNLVVAEPFSEAVRKIDSATGIIRTVAGRRFSTDPGDNGPATAASVFPNGICFDRAGNLFIADWRRIRRVDAASGIITTVAGDGSSPSGPNGDGGPAKDASILPQGPIAVDEAGTIYFIDGYSIRKVDRTTQIITTIVAGNAASISFDLTLDGDGNLLFLEQVCCAPGWHARIRKMDRSKGIINTVTELNNVGLFESGVYRILLDASGNLFMIETFSGGFSKVLKLDGKTRSITEVAGKIATTSFGDGGPATAATLIDPVDVAVDGSGNLYIADVGRGVRKVDARTGQISMLAAFEQRLNAVAGDSSSNLYVAGVSGISRIDAATGEITGVATQTAFNCTTGVAVDSADNLYIIDEYNFVVRKVDSATGIIRTIAGNGMSGFSGDGGPATTASLDFDSIVPVHRGMAVDNDGNLYIVTGGGRVRKVSAETGIISTFFVSQGGLGPLSFDGRGNLLVGEAGRIRRINLRNGTSSIVAGNGMLNFSGDNLPATEASFSPHGLAVDSRGNIFVADEGNHRILGIRGPIP